MQCDVAVIGGSFAGLAAALQIVRTRRPVVVIDAGAPRNRFANEAHGFLGQDGRAPGAILEDARTQLLRYPAARVLDATAHRVKKNGAGFVVETSAGQVEARRLVLAMGVKDTLPDVPGLAERWGRSVIHCPYCHGFEVAGRRLSVLASHPLSMHQAQLVADWGPVTLFTNGAFVPSEEEAAHLARLGIAVEETPVAGLRGDAPALTGVLLADGSVTPLDALFVASRVSPVGTLVADLGCAMTEGPLGPWVTVDAFQQTSVPGVFAGGDLTRMMHSVSLAVADGALAGVGAHRSLVFD